VRRLNIFLLLIALQWGCKKDVVKPPLQQTDGKTGMLAAVNSLRQAGCTCGTTVMPPVPPLIWSDTLQTAANEHARDMYFNNYFSHIAPDGSSPIQRAQTAGYTGTSILENIAEGYYNLTDVINGWKQSEDHCRAMMDSSSTEMGAARANQYWVQEFGKP